MKEVYFQDLMTRSQNGDREAYSNLLEEISPYICRLISTRIGKDLQDDVLQETLITLHRIRHTYNPEQPFFPWLNAITFRRMNDALRSEYRHNRRIAAVLLEVENEIREEIKISERVTEALSTLPERQREIVSLHKLEGFSLNEIAERLSITLAATKMSAHRAYEKLRTILTTEEADEQ